MVSISIADKNINKKILILENKAKMLKRLHFIRNVMLSNGAYHNQNLDKQINSLEMANAPNDEVMLIKKSNTVCSKMAKEIMKEYKEIMNDLKNIYE